MKMILDSKRHHYAVRVSVFMIIVTLVAGMVGCFGYDYNPFPSQNLEIRDWYDLDAVRNNLAGNHTLMNDLDFTTAGYEELASPTANQGKGWDSIGWFYAAPFTGSLDGQGYEIRDLFINRPQYNQVALFGFVGEAGAIQNVGVVNATVTGGEPVGGLVAQNDGTVSNSYSTANVIGDEWVGGLVGFNNDGTVSNSYSSSNVIGEYSSSNVTGEGWWVGGLVGFNDGTVSNSYSTANVSGNNGVGSLVGFNTGTVSNSYSTGSVIGNVNFGGLVGQNSGTVSNSFWDTQTSGKDTSNGGTGKTTAEMQDIATFSSAGWNIAAVALGSTNKIYVWNIVNGVIYPFLSWQS